MRYIHKVFRLLKEKPNKRIRIIRARKKGRKICPAVLKGTSTPLQLHLGKAVIWLSAGFPSERTEKLKRH